MVVLGSLSIIHLPQQTILKGTMLKKIPFINMMREEGLPIFQKWEAKGDKIDY